jgi:orotidine-5'-phosphate decarboxylase
MLDLKYHDIPSTVEASCRAAVRHRVVALTVHGCGEPAMLEAAARAVRREARRLGMRRPRVWAVTVLTSIGAGAAGLSQHVRQRARAAAAAGCDGVVASAQEARWLKRRFGRRLDVVCPGIRPACAAPGAAGRPAGIRRDDQARVAGPAAAVRAGADWLVVGRPIAAARDPRAAALRILHELKEARGC